MNARHQTAIDRAGRKRFLWKIAVAWITLLVVIGLGFAWAISKI